MELASKLHPALSECVGVSQTSKNPMEPLYALDLITQRIRPRAQQFTSIACHLQVETTTVQLKDLRQGRLLLELKNSESVFSEIVPQLQALQSQRQLDPADPVEQFFITPIPEALWHYTTLSGLEGILRSGRIWATEARHTTDEREFVHAHDWAISYLNNLEPKTDSERRARQDCQQIVEEEFGTGALSEKATEVLGFTYLTPLEHRRFPQRRV
jgi:hypothetical protein